MKKFYTAVAMAFAVTATWAQAPANAGFPFAERSETQTTNFFMGSVSERAYSSASVAANGAAKAPLRLPDASQIISEQPEGTLYKNMYRKAEGLDNGYEKTYEGYADDVVVSKDQKKLYIKTPFPSYYTGWIVGDLDESGIVTFKFPQVVYHQQAGEATGLNELTEYAWKIVLDNVNWKVYLDKTTQEVKFKWEDNKLTQLNPDDVIGMADANGMFAGYASYGNEYSVMTEQPVKPADVLAAKTYKMTYTDYATQQAASKSVQLIFDGNDVYMGRFYNNYWIKGTKDGDKISFPRNQYLGLETIGKVNVHEFMVSVGIADDNQSVIEYDNLEFILTEATGALVSDQILGVNVGKGDAGLVGVIMYPTLLKTDFVVGTPAKPEIASVLPYNTQMQGVSGLVYKLSTKTNDGKEMDDECIFYNVYLDGQLQTFTPEDYYYLTGEMTDIPFAFADYNFTQSSGAVGFDFQVLSNMECVFFYKNFQKVGLKAIYNDGTTRNESEMAEFDLNDLAGIGSAAVNEGTTAKNVTYHDLSGRKLSAPAKGISIKTVEMENGTVKTVKIIK